MHPLLYEEITVTTHAETQAQFTFQQQIDELIQAAFSKQPKKLK
jgi:hypothetical protein